HTRSKLYWSSDVCSPVLALRSGHFQEKVADVLGSVREGGVYPVFATSADTPIPMVATRDIGEVAAQALLYPPASSESVDLIGPEHGRTSSREGEEVKVGR